MNVLDIISENRGEQHAQVLRMHGEEVAQIESNNRFDAVQKQRDTNQTKGPGRGLFQYEVSENAMGGAKGSGASKTALTRYKQFYEHYGQEIPQEFKEELNRVNSDNPDFSKLSRELQEEIFYADKERGKMPLDELASGQLSLKDAYVDYHWIGNRSSQNYDTERERVSTLYEGKIGPVDDIQPMKPTMTNNEFIMQEGKKAASKVTGTTFNILNVMKDLGQVFQQFEKEEQ